MQPYKKLLLENDQLNICALFVLSRQLRLLHNVPQRLNQQAEEAEQAEQAEAQQQQQTQQQSGTGGNLVDSSLGFHSAAVAAFLQGAVLLLSTKPAILSRAPSEIFVLNSLTDILG